MNQDRRVTFAGTLVPREDLLTAPASGSACVHWRLKIIEPIDARLQLVHEMASPEGFDVAWALPAISEPRAPSDLATSDATSDASSDASSDRDPGLRQLRRLAAEARDPLVRVRVVPESLRLTATPALHRPGSPGALRVAQQFGFSNSIAVEEIALAEGERVSAAGFLEGGALGSPRGPFREVTTEVELHEAALAIATRREIGPALLPWALGTAAAIFGGVGAAAWAAWHFGLMPHGRAGAPPAQRLLIPEIGPPHYGRRHFSRPD